MTYADLLAQYEDTQQTHESLLGARRNEICATIKAFREDEKQHLEVLVQHKAALDKVLKEDLRVLLQTEELKTTRAEIRGNEELDRFVLEDPTLWLIAALPPIKVGGVGTYEDDDGDSEVGISLEFTDYQGKLRVLEFDWPNWYDDMDVVDSDRLRDVALEAAYQLVKSLKQDRKGDLESWLKEQPQEAAFLLSAPADLALGDAIESAIAYELVVLILGATNILLDHPMPAPF